MGLFGSLFDLASDVVTIVATPVEAVLDLTDAAVKPIAEVVKDLGKDIKSLKD